MKFDVLIPTRGDILKLDGILKSIQTQTLKPENIFVAIDKYIYDADMNYFLEHLSYKELDGKLKLITNINTDFIPGKGVAYVRNYLVKICKSDFIYFIDDDNIFSEDLFENTVKEWQSLNDETQRDFLYSPTIMYRRTGIVQSQGLKDLSFFFPKLFNIKLGGLDFGYAHMIGANSLFGPKFIFWKVKFDEDIGFIAEDLDFSYRVNMMGYLIIVSNKTRIYHMERDKTDLEKLFIGTEQDAFRKIRNWILFVRKNGSWFQKLQYFCIGLWMQVIGSCIKIFWFAPKKKKFLLTFAIFKGIRAGMKSGVSLS